MNDLILFCPSSYYASQKKTLEINPRHPLVKTLLAKVEDDTDDVTAKDLAVVMYETAVLRSGIPAPRFGRLCWQDRTHAQNQHEPWPQWKGAYNWKGIV